MATWSIFGLLKLRSFQLLLVLHFLSWHVLWSVPDQVHDAEGVDSLEYVA